MNIEESKKALVALVKQEGSGIMDRTDRSAFIANMEDADTASDAIALVKDSFHPLYLSYGEAFLNWVREAFTGELWASQNVLINPSEVPLSETAPQIVVSDGAIPVVQDVRSAVAYYGDVDLKVLDGAAYVYDTKHKVTVNGGMLYAFGQTAVEAMDRSGLFLSERSRATVSGEVKILAADLSFVECKAGHPSIQASNEAQILVSGGSVDLIMGDHTRCVITTKETPERPNTVAMSGSCLFYTPKTDSNFIRIKNISKVNAGLLRGEEWHVTPEEMRDLIVPRCKERVPEVRKGIEKPIALEALKEAILTLLPKDTLSDLSDKIFRAENEGEVCQAITSRIPDLVANGMSGDFLRSHFTEKVLNANGIFTNYGTKADYSIPQGKNPLYFFGNQYVNANSFNRQTFCFERTLVLDSQNSEFVHVVQSAAAIAYNLASVKAHGYAKVIANHGVIVTAFQESEVLLNGKSVCAAYEHAKVQAHDKSDVWAGGSVSALLYEESQALARESAKVLTAGNNKVSAYDEATIAFGVYDPDLQPEIKVYDREVNLVGLDTKEKFDRYKAEFLNEGKERLTQSTRMGR